MNFNFLKYKKIYYFLSLCLGLSSLFFLFVFQLNFGIDFLGGSILEIEFKERVENLIVEEKLKTLDLGELNVQSIAEKGFIFRFKETGETTHKKILAKLQEITEFEEKRFESIGPVISREIREKTIFLTITSLLAMLFYIAFSFRKISFPLSSWQYGLISIFALSFDVLFCLGIFSFLGKFNNVQFSIPIVTALLTVIGYTVNDKIVVLDRIRENLLMLKKADFEEIINLSLNQILIRSFSTGTCSLLVLAALFLWGGETLKYFVLTLILGILIGTFSSLFLAAPLCTSLFKTKVKT